MRYVAVLIAALTATATVGSEAQADEGLPSEAMLAEMGLSGIQVISDGEASDVRGSGYSWGGGAYRYKQGIYKYHNWVHKFRVWTKKFQRYTKNIHRHVAKKHRPYGGYGGYGGYAKSGKRW